MMRNMQIGDQIEVEPAELVAGGDALARVDGMPVFVKATYPGDLARIRITELKKGFARGELVSIVRPSPLRRTEPCPIAGECGGCDWTALRLDAQLRAKERILRESLRRIGKIDPAALPPITIHPSPLNYRIRSRLHRTGGAIGFFALRSNRVVPLAAECEVVGPATARAFGIAESQRGDAAMAGEATDGDEIRVWEIEGRLSTDGAMSIGGYHVPHDAFFQVNRHLLATMLRRVIELAGRTHSTGSAVDLYSGVGFFSAALASRFSHVIAVEGSPISHGAAMQNVPANVELVHAAVESWVRRMPDADFVFLDPPRSGTRREVIDAVSARAREVICFLACDPVTFARDASRLIASGWRLSTLDILDLFPNTHHVETLSSFERAR